MLATAAKLSRALAATFGVLLSGLALEVQSEALLLVTQYPLPASAGNWAGGFWQIVSVKETNNLIQCVSGPRVHSAALFYCGKWRSLEPARPSIVFSLTGPAPTRAPSGRSRAIY